MELLASKLYKSQRPGRNEQNILSAARHAFLKYGYHGTTLKMIARYAGTGRAAIHYYFRSKDLLFEIVLRHYIRLLLILVKDINAVDVELSFEKRKIEYPELYSIAWFVANEFNTNAEMAFTIINKDEEIRKEFHSAYENRGLKEKFERLIRINLHAILQKCRVRIEPL